MSNDTFTCVDCNGNFPVQKEGGTGYASRHKADEFGPAGKICYSCCAEADRKYMEIHDKITLYLAKRNCSGVKPTTKCVKCAEALRYLNDHHTPSEYHVTNWPGTLSFKAIVTKGRHNWARVRYDAWFRDHTGQEWHGVSIGDNTQLLHCKKLKLKKGEVG